MTALTDARVKTESKRTGKIHSFKVKGGVKIYAGSMVMLSAGYARPATAVSGNKGCPGVATETVDNTTGSDGDVEVRVQEGCFRFTGVGLAATDIGKLAYASDDQTFSTTQASNEPVAGVVDRVESSTDGWIDMGPGIVN